MSCGDGLECLRLLRTQAVDRTGRASTCCSAGEAVATHYMGQILQGFDRRHINPLTVSTPHE